MAAEEKGQKRWLRSFSMEEYDKYFVKPRKLETLKRLSNESEKEKPHMAQSTDKNLETPAEKYLRKTQDLDKLSPAPSSPAEKKLPPQTEDLDKFPPAEELAAEK